MSIQTIYASRRVHRPITLPNIYIEIRRKDLWASALIFLAGLSIPLLWIFQVIVPGFALGFVGFGLTFLGGILWLVRIGEVA